MSLILEAVRHKPVGLFAMDDTSPLQDYSPFNRVATYTGAPPQHAALAKGALYAPVFKSSSVASFESPVFVQGREGDEFSLMASVFLVTASATPTGVSLILGHTGQYDGLTIDGTTVSFSTKYLTAGEAKCSYDVKRIQAMDVVGVHTFAKNSLYVNGELVAEANITDAQRHDQYIATNGNLYCGETATTNQLAVNGIGYFDHALRADEVSSIHSESRWVTSTREVPSMFNGLAITLSRDAADIFATAEWSTPTDWYSGHISGAAISHGNLVPQFNSGVSLASAWYDTFVLSTGETSIYGVTLDWDGAGATVDVSLDGTTWTPVTRNVNISIIPPGFNPTNKELLIRISFAGGIVDDTSYVSSLRVTGIRTATASTWTGRSITLSGAYQQNSAEALGFHNSWGAKIDAGGTITISPDTNTLGAVARTIELWIRSDDGSAGINVTGTAYQNGVVTAATLPIGQWTLYHVVAPADVTTNIVISGAAQVGQVAIYPTALNASQIAEINAAYSGANTLKVGDNSPVVISESPSAVQIYAYNWSILSAG